ncbi:MAG TPA: hypothetical protein VFQ53_09440 [Kofleriaceae bacterium]|nr:hypothetical protein [Kofleriaceae bacterium]
MPARDAASDPQPPKVASEPPKGIARPPMTTTGVVALLHGRVAPIVLSRAARARWLDVWTRAVIVPAWRRASAVWVGTAIVAAVIFGPTGMSPGDLTGLALHNPGVGAMLGTTWLLVFAPTARLLVRGDAASYLRSLPGPTVAPIVLAVAALVGLQLPWLLLWVIGEGLLGLGVVAALTAVILVLARWRPPQLRARWPGWKRDGEALRAIHVRALRRRAGDAIVRGAGLSILAGVAAGLFIRNNALAGADAATIGASVIVIVLVPAQVGVLLVILATHRSTAWLASSLGISHAARVAAVLYAILVVELVATAIAVGAACVLVEPDPRTATWLASTAGVVAVASAMATTRVLLGDEASVTIASRAVAGSVLVAAIAVLCLGTFGELGAIAFVATAALALFTVKPVVPA